MKVHELFEAKNKNYLSADRIFINNRKLENSMNIPAEAFSNKGIEIFVGQNGRLGIICKKGEVKENVEYEVEASSKPGFSPYYPGKGLQKVTFTSKGTLLGLPKINVAITKAALKLLGGKGEMQPKDSDLTNDSNPEDGFFALGSWGNPYRSNDDEYFWSGPFLTKKEASQWLTMKQQKGQPKRFTNWVKGSSKVFKGVDAFKNQANKVGLNPKLDDLYWME